MAQGFADWQARFHDRHMWRMLLARLHPDVGGDHELFLFACALKDRLYEDDHPGAADRQEGREKNLSAWRLAMSSWASHNREGLRKPRVSRRPRRSR